MSEVTETAALLARVDRLERRLGELEDVNAIRRLHYAYGYYIDLCHYAEVVAAVRARRGGDLPVGHLSRP